MSGRPAGNRAGKRVRVLYITIHLKCCGQRVTGGRTKSFAIAARRLSLMRCQFDFGARLDHASGDLGDSGDLGETVPITGRQASLGGATT